MTLQVPFNDPVKHHMNFMSDPRKNDVEDERYVRNQSLFALLKLSSYLTRITYSFNYVQIKNFSPEKCIPVAYRNHLVFVSDTLKCHMKLIRG